MCIGLHDAYSIAVKASVTDTMTHKSCSWLVGVEFKALLDTARFWTHGEQSPYFKAARISLEHGV